MEEVAVDVLKWLLSRTDPILGGAMIVMGLWGWRMQKRMNWHLDPQLQNPHVSCCSPHQASIDDLAEQVDANRQEGASALDTMRREILALIEIQRQENRDDHKEIFRLIRELSARQEAR